MKRTWISFLLLLFGLSAATLYGQGRKYQGPDDEAGDIAAERAGFMTGNRVLLFFRNTTELSDCCGLGYWVSKWPNNFEGTKMHDGIAVLVGAQVFVENGATPVTDPVQIATRRDLDTLWFVQSSFREFMDRDPTGTIEWGFYPIFGYFNELSETPAMSDNPGSWPTKGWPARGDELKWPGEWNGRFGRGIMKADLESYFVVNDAQDQEYLEPDDSVKYAPRPGVTIGSKHPEQITIQRGAPWGGLGLRIAVRGMQWANPQANDAIFWEYDIANISDYDVPRMFFGYQLDNAVGGEEGEGDDIGYYSKPLNMCYSWDYDGIPVGGGREPGLLGFAFLESPGIMYDGMDNDNDGLADERRDNLATRLIGPTEGIANLAAFKTYYSLNDADLREHWDADEDQDWQDGQDINNNGLYDFGENAGDDVGLDGVGPYDINYTGPDADGTECNHRPDMIEGIGAEPNFGVTDITESDMLGLTSFRYLLKWIAGTGGVNTMQIDKSVWEYLTRDIFDDLQPTPTNFIEYFSSGTFTLHKGLTERISMSELHAYDPLAGLMASYTAPALFRLKSVCQLIYETDYRFAQPPLMPTLSATPMDGKVILTWDNIAEHFTREPFLKNINDFEGYKLYRATDKRLSDPEIITDGYGTPRFRNPLFQCDLVDNRSGFTDFGYVDGTGFNLGSDTGIQNYFIDNTVQNGRTYYYVLAAYDYGIDSLVVGGISPSENTFTLNVDTGTEEVNKISKNVAVVVPHQMASGYVAPEVEEFSTNNALGTGSVSPNIIVPSFLKEGHTYKVKFPAEILVKPADIFYGMTWRNSGIQVYDASNGDSLVYSESAASFTGNNFIWVEDYTKSWDVRKGFYLNVGKELKTAQFDGLYLNFNVPVLLAELDQQKSGWLKGSAPIRITQPREDIRYFPYDFDIVFTGVDSTYVGKTQYATMKDENQGRLDAKELILKHPFNFYVENRSIKDAEGKNRIMELIVHDVDRNGKFDWLIDRVLVGELTTSGRRPGMWAGLAFVIDLHNAMSEAELPKAGDVYHVNFQRPFAPSDSITFKVRGVGPVDQVTITDDMEQIRVVPNPYVASNTMETSVANFQLNQKRQLMFTHLPAQCTIKIFTVTGVLVDEIEVNNSAASRKNPWDTNSEANGTAHWDLLTREGLEVAAGYYLYHVKSTLTGAEKIGKFAIIK